MKKEIIRRGLHGIPQGIAISYVISLVMSHITGDGNFYTVAVPLVDLLGSEISAVTVQIVLSALIGSGFGMASVIWEIDEWSIVKQTGIYFTLTSIFFLPVSYFLHWMERSVVGFLIYFGVFLLVFVMTWVAQYFVWKGKVKQINEKLRR